MAPRRRPPVKVIAAAVSAAALLAAGIVLGVALTRPAPLTVRNLRIAVVDGPHGNQHVVLDASFFLPPGTGKVPAILLAHGFGETKYAVQPEAEYLARAGFAVLTWSARGFGASTGQIGLDSPDYEVKDVEQLVTWLARQPRVLLDHPGDPRVGITGASYGGGIALLAAAYDHRIDTVVAQSTWNNLATALFPNGAGGGPAAGVFKRQWAGLPVPATSQPGGTGPGITLPPAGTARSVLCGRFQPQICAMYQQIATTGRATPQAISLLLRSSPASVAGRMRAPTLLLQGENDSLFGMDQANANYQAIRRNGGPVNMVWFAGGHDGGDQEATRINALTAQWFSHWLSPGRPAPPRPATSGQGVTGQAATGQPGFAVTRVLGFDPSADQASLGIATAGSYPGLAGTTRRLVRLTGPPQAIVSPAGGAPASISVFPGLGPLGAPGLTFDMPGQSAAFTTAPLASPLQLTGSPVVRIRVSGAPAVTLSARSTTSTRRATPLCPASWYRRCGSPARSAA